MPYDKYNDKRSKTGRYVTWGKGRSDVYMTLHGGGLGLKSGLKIVTWFKDNP